MGYRSSSVADPAFSSKYKFRRVIGRGSNSKIVEVVELSSSRSFAAKIMPRDNNDSSRAEADVLRRLSHPHIVRMHDFVETRDHCIIVMDLVTGGELLDHIFDRGTFSEQDASAIVGSILSALDYMHAQGCVHRDLKPENLLFESNAPNARIMIADFGLARLKRQGDDKLLMTTQCGTPTYCAPEVLAGKLPYGKAVDMWSLGVIVYLLLSGRPAFQDDNGNILFDNIMAGKFDFDGAVWEGTSSDAKDFISQLLQTDAERRLSAREALQHPWVSGSACVSRKNIFEMIRDKLERSLRSRWVRSINTVIAIERLRKSAVQPTPRIKPLIRAHSVDDIDESSPPRSPRLSRGRSVDIVAAAAAASTSNPGDFSPLRYPLST
eukprot:Opistho-1_new@98788